MIAPAGRLRWILVLGGGLLAAGCVNADPESVPSATAMGVPAAAPAPPVPPPPFDSTPHGTAYYVRVDGGEADQCTGTADAPYPGRGTRQACAWNSLHQALPSTGQARIKGGDTLYVAPGTYPLGVHAPGALGGRCYADAPWDCHLAPVPGGPDARTPTRILGQDPARPPVLRGHERVSHLLDLNGSANVEVAHLVLTDGSPCVEFHADPTAKCERDAAPFGEWASSGISASASRKVWLHDLDIHGLANRGIIAGGLTDWTVERVRIHANGWAGWDGDIGDGSSNSGEIVLRHVEIGFNGCGETLDGTPWACWAQNAGGYGDGLGTARTGGHWLIEDSHVHHNTSDGVDLLYMDGSADSSVTIRRVRAEGNAGNQIKTQGRALIESSVVVGNCAYFEGQGRMQADDLCRALGNALSIGLVEGQPAELRHNTITGEGDCLVLSEGGDPSSQLILANNILLGRIDWRQSPELACGHYAHQSPARVSYAGNLFWHVKDGQCPGDSRCEDPKLANAGFDAFDPMPLGDSPVLGAGAPDREGNRFDLEGRLFIADTPDIGAVQRPRGRQALNTGSEK